MRNHFIVTFLSLLSLPFILGLSPGQEAPQFSAKNQDGKIVQLSDFKGKFLLIYFYPKDDTPGCTKEACSLRDRFPKFKDNNVVVLGVSRQDSKSHKEFRDKYKLPFDLIADTDGKVSKTFGVGTVPVLGFTHRESILISPEGKVLQFYHSVDPATHADEVLKDVKKQKE